MDRTVQRFLRAVPETFWILLGCITVFGLLYSPYLFFSQVLASGDNMGFIYPFFKSLKAFSLSSMLADPLTGRGYPWIVTYGTLDPITHILRALTDPYRMLAWLVFISLSGAAFFQALFLRKGGHSSLASFIGGITFAAAPWIAFGDHSPAFGLLLFSASLYTARFFRQHPFIVTTMLAFFTTYLWFNVHYHYTALCLMGTGLYMAYESYYAKGSVWQRLAAIRIWLISTAIGTFLGLFKLLPALAYLTLSERTGGYSLADASVDHLSFTLLYNSFFPYLRLPLIGTAEVGAFYGSAGIALLIIGMWAGGKKALPMTLGWLTALAIGLPHSPIFWIAYHLPFINYLHGPSRYLFIGHAAGTVLIALAFDHITSNDWQIQRRRIGRIFLWLGSIAGIAGLVTTMARPWLLTPLVNRSQMYFDAHLFAQTSGLPREHYHTLIKTIWRQFFESFSLSSPLFLIPLTLLLMTGWMLGRQFDSWSNPLKRHTLATVAIIGAVWGLFFYHPHADRSTIKSLQQMTTLPQLHEEYVLPVMPGLADFTHRNAMPDGTREEQLRYQLGVLMPNRHALLDIPSLDFYQPLQPTRMSRLLAALGSNIAIAKPDEQLFAAKMPLEAKLDIIASRKELLSLLGIRTLVSTWELPYPFRLIDSYSPVVRLPDVYVYEAPNPRPIAYAPTSIEMFEPDEDHAVTTLRNLTDPNLSTIECNVCPSLSPSASTTILLHKSTSNATQERFSVSASQDTWIIVSRLRLPGWRTFIDGKPVHTAIANSLFFGIPVPKGEHEIEIRITYASLLEDSINIVLRKKQPWLL